jgi:hypothetical protein
MNQSITNTILALPLIAVAFSAYGSTNYEFRQKVAGLVTDQVGAGSQPLNSCKSILDTGNSTGNGVYQIDPNGRGTIDVYCDMTTDGGGWTLVVAQFEADPSTNWNEGIQTDYDPSLTSGSTFLLSSKEIPDHTQMAFGQGLNPTAIDYVNGVYVTGDIPKTEYVGIKTGLNYHLHRSSSHYFMAHNPDNSPITTNAEWFGTLTFDEVGVAGYNWAFGPGRSASNASEAGYAILGAKQISTIADEAWTVWVR